MIIIKIEAMKPLLSMLILLFSGLFLQAQEEINIPSSLPAIDFSRETRPEAVVMAPLDSSVLDSVLLLTTSQVNNDSIYSYMQGLVSFGTRFMLAANHREVAEWIRQKFLSFGFTNARLDSFECVEEWPLNSGILDTSWQYNVLATLDGSLDPQMNCITGGHYDAIIYSGGDPYITAPGADDNASAIAVTLETARVLKSTGYVPKTSITFAAWAGEERGLNGSFNYVIQAYNNHDNVKAYLNNDMVSYYQDTTSWVFNVNQYSGSRWLGDMARAAAQGYTLLQPDTSTGNSQGSDSYAFYAAGFPSLYFSSDEFTPYYHTPNDQLSTCNIPYCADITRVTMGTLLMADQYPSPVKLDVFNPGTGNSLIPRWSPNPESDIACYRVRKGTLPNTFYQEVTTTDTSYTFTGLSPDTVYYFAVSAMNNDSMNGPAAIVHDKPVLVTMDQGILIVDDSEGGILNPEDTTVDAFYRQTLASFQYSEYDAFMEQKISLADLGKYSSVLWHINKQTTITVLNRFMPEVVKYLRLGGNILFTVYQPEKAIFKLSYYPVSWSEGNFIYDYLQIQTHDLQTASYFNTAVPYNTTFPMLQTDTSKTMANLDHHLSHIEALYPNPLGTIIYTYGSGYDSATPQGGMTGMPVGVMTQNAPWKVVTLSFPLYYMQLPEARTFVEQVMYQYFGESPIGMPDQGNPAFLLAVFPNPASGQLTLQYTNTSGHPLKAALYNLLGERLKNLVLPNEGVGLNSCSLDVRSLVPGVYILKVTDGTAACIRKVVIDR